MNSTEMVRRMRVFLDEKTGEEDFYEDSDLYQALTQAQLEVAKTIATTWYEKLRPLLKPVPYAIQSLMTSKSGTLTGGTYFTVTDALVHILMQTGASLITIHNYMENDDIGAMLRANLLLNNAPTFYQVATYIYVSNPETSAYKYSYIKVPPDITMTVSSELNETAHDAIISRALAIALSDSEAELATSMMQVYQGQLQGLLQ